MSFPACPRCQAPIRIRDRKFVGREIPCPSCTAPVVPLVDGRDHWQVMLPEEYARQTGSRDVPRNSSQGGLASGVMMQGAKTAAMKQVQSARRTGFGLKSFSPFVLAWIGSGIITLCIVMVIVNSFPRKDHQTSERKIQLPIEGSTQTPLGEGTVADQKPVVAAAPIPASHEKLSSLGQWLSGELATQGAFPSSTIGHSDHPEEAWGWLNRYVAQTQPAIAPPPFEGSWRGPNHDRFIRRRMNSLLINEQEGLVGSDGYPATQLVGVAGIGVDGPNLPVSSEYAGVFGYGRTTRQRDILDGLSQTAIVATVKKDLASWASGGKGSIRALTAAPVIDGPDGFGIVGQSGQLLLMADGSVKDLSSSTDPVVMRRMFTMAEGVDLSEPAAPDDQLFPARTVPGNSPSGVDSQAQTESLVESRPQAQTEIKPVTDELVNEKPDGKSENPLTAKVPAQPATMAPQPQIVVQTQDVSANLGVSLQRFRTDEPISRRRLVKSAADMLGAKVSFPQEPLPPELTEALEQSIALDLEKVTIEKLLDEIFRDSQIEWSIQGSNLLLQLRSDVIKK